MTYTVFFEDENGCKAQDDIQISFDAIIYVPNTFTPDEDKFNPIFKAEGGNIVEFHMIIFNRWGEIMFESYNFNVGWDGTYGGKICQDGTYIWVIEYKDNGNNKNRLVGHVNLLK
jgi:gliding motility-associated-like protein